MALALDVPDVSDAALGVEIGLLGVQASRADSQIALGRCAGRLAGSRAAQRRGGHRLDQGEGKGGSNHDG